ncbi:MAG: tRNA/rRNA methyltransferase (SpoU) [uncultured bacterium]|nr:MAG: tRNA/rRNA methyltransferase (SpoU) [uncultured bacterium]
MSFPIITICDNIRSLYNVGAIFRTSDAANIEKIYLCGITGYPKNDPNWFQTKRIEKTALGATKTVPWSYRKDTVRLINKLKRDGIKIYALETVLHATCYMNCNYTFPCALVLGHETQGINPKILDLVDEIIQIPMYGTKTSLNVEVAYAIAVYEILKHLPQTLNHKNKKLC